MGIRRQDQYLASRYVTNGWLAARPPLQKDFERESLEIIDPDKGYFIDGIWLDYKTTHDLTSGRCWRKKPVGASRRAIGQ
jgi:hypothetical protein